MMDCMMREIFYTFAESEFSLSQFSKQLRDLTANVVFTQKTGLGSLEIFLHSSYLDMKMKLFRMLLEPAAKESN